MKQQIVNKSKIIAIPNMTKIPFMAIERWSDCKTILSKGELRRLRKGINKGRINKLELPYNAETINAICCWSKPIADTDLLPVPASVNAPEPLIEATTKAVELEVPVKNKRKVAVKKPAARKKTTITA